MSFENFPPSFEQPESPEERAFISDREPLVDEIDQLGLAKDVSPLERATQLSDDDLVHLTERFGADAPALRDSWRKSVEAGVPLFENLDQSLVLEQLAPGAVSYFKRNNNITHFGRYPLKLLLSMYEQRNDGGNWGIVVFAKSDHNGALNYKRTALAEMSATLGKSCKMRIVECGSAGEATDMLESMAGRHGRAGFAVFCAHGSEQGISLSEGGSDISKESLHNEFGEVLARSMEPDAAICLASCSTGVEDGVGEAMSISSGLDAMAPDADSSLESFGAAISLGRVTFQPRYRGAATRELKNKDLAARQPVETDPTPRLIDVR